MARRSLLLLVALLLLVSCGKNNNFQATDTPEFQLEGPGFLELVLPPDNMRTRSQEAVVLRNSGDGPMQITTLEWVDKPDRLVTLGERGDSCSTTDDCGAEEICLTSSSLCVATGFRTTPFELGPQRRTDLEFAITVGPTELECPEPGADVPIDYQDRYCGALRIQTNADNDFGDTVDDGGAMVYFLDSGMSGNIQVEPSFLEFTNVQPGTTATQTFAITNAGMNDLTINRMGVEDNPTYFTFTNTEGGNLPITIGSGTSQTWEAEVSIPAGETDYETFTNLNIESSAGIAKVAIQITSDAGSAPVIELSDTSLSGFDAAASQTLTVTNTGQATLALQGLNVRPATTRPFYTFTIDGTDVTNNFMNVNIPMGDSKDIVVDFARPVGNEDPSVGVLEISHNDANEGFLSEVTLLGDEGDVPIASVHPSSFTFQAEDGNSDTREFVVRNAGTAALDITGITWTFSTGSNAEFQVSPTTGTVAPGGILAGTVTFSGQNATPDVGIAVLDSNNTTPVELSLRGLASAAEQPVPVITVTNQGATVTGSPVNLSANDSTPDGVETNAIWTIVSRPASSTVFLDAVGGTASFLPDVAGTYTVALTILSGDREGQATTDIVVE